MTSHNLYSSPGLERWKSDDKDNVELEYQRRCLGDTWAHKHGNSNGYPKHINHEADEVIYNNEEDHSLIKACHDYNFKPDCFLGRNDGTCKDHCKCKKDKYKHDCQCHQYHHTQLPTTEHNHRHVVTSSSGHHQFALENNNFVSGVFPSVPNNHVSVLNDNHRLRHFVNKSLKQQSLTETKSLHHNGFIGKDSVYSGFEGFDKNHFLITKQPGVNNSDWVTGSSPDPTHELLVVNGVPHRSIRLLRGHHYSITYKYRPTRHGVAEVVAPAGETDNIMVTSSNIGGPGAVPIPGHQFIPLNATISFYVPKHFPDVLFIQSDKNTSVGLNVAILDESVEYSVHQRYLNYASDDYNNQFN